jgi:hypothetical protein
MTFPISVEVENGSYIASLIGEPALRVVETTRGQALATLRMRLQQRIAQGELLALEIEPVGVSTLAGKYQDDPTLLEICEQAYQFRDAEQPA